jgi:3-oxoacyl-[acyl-carrier-protein] synthase-3
MSFAKILGTGSYLPEKILTNAELEKTIDTSDEWIRERTGIAQRHVAAEHETASSMAEQASLRALQAAGLNPTDIDLIIVGTVTPDKVFPSTACLLQERLGAGKCIAFDINAVCSGFVYALSVADQFIRSGMVKTALVVGSETLTRMLDWQDRSTCVLFGDGAGAMILGASDEPGIYSTHLHADGNYKDLLHVPSLMPSQRKAHEQPFLQMEGRELFKVAVTELGNLVDETLAKNNLPQSAIDWLIPHQANQRIIMAAAKKLGLPEERVIMTVADQANTSAASVPLALDTGIRDGRIKRGDLLLLEAFGGGLTWGSALIRY